MLRDAHIDPLSLQPYSHPEDDSCNVRRNVIPSTLLSSESWSYELDMRYVNLKTVIHIIFIICVYSESPFPLQTAWTLHALQGCILRCGAACYRTALRHIRKDPKRDTIVRTWGHTLGTLFLLGTFCILFSSSLCLTVACFLIATRQLV
jgi:hypothetical protein